MLKRLYFPLVLLFWVVMNTLLWRSEMVGRQSGSPVAADSVWAKILTAPDDSSLAILRQGQKVGYCRWVPNVGEAQATGKRAVSDEEISGQVRRLAGYTIDLEGNLGVPEIPQRVRFTWHAEFLSNQTWRTMSLRVAERPSVWEVKADQITQTLRVRQDDPRQKWDWTFSFKQLAQPALLLGMLGVGADNEWLRELEALTPPNTSTNAPSLGLAWEAQTDSLVVGRSTMRVYRLSARLVDKYQVLIYVSRVGEILRAEFPGGLVLLNEGIFIP